MLSGHSLVKIIITFAYSTGIAGNSWLVISIFMQLIVALVTILEFAIAFLQAYVYIVLICSYLNDVINAGH